MAVVKSAYTFYGAVLWVLGIQYYIVQIIVAQGWSNPGYSLSRNTISDLGNTVCGQYGHSLVCSPRHGLMNLSFVVLGVTMAAGACLLNKKFGVSRQTSLEFLCLAIAGAGTLLIGLFPENTISTMHIIGATLPFVLGNIGLVTLGLTLKQIPRALSLCGLLFGIIALAALPLFLTHTYLGIGIGGMERIVAYPQTIWMILFGAYVLFDHSQRCFATPAKKLL